MHRISRSLPGANLNGSDQSRRGERLMASDLRFRVCLVCYHHADVWNGQLRKTFSQVQLTSAWGWSTVNRSFLQLHRSKVMSTQERMIGNWNQIKGKVKQRWGQLTDDELSEVEGNIDQLVGLIQQKTGDAREQIERVVNELGRAPEASSCRLRKQRANTPVRPATPFATWPSRFAIAASRRTKEPRKYFGVGPPSRSSRPSVPVS